MPLEINSAHSSFTVDMVFEKLALTYLFVLFYPI